MTKTYCLKGCDEDLVMEKSNYRCWYCGKELYNHRTEHRMSSVKESGTIDHVFPQHHGGSSTIDNLVPSCRSCNSRKSTMTIDEFRVKAKVSQFYFEREGLR